MKNANQLLAFVTGGTHWLRKFSPTEVDSICSACTVPCTGFKMQFTQQNCNLVPELLQNCTQALGIGKIVKQVPKVVITTQDRQNCLKTPKGGQLQTSPQVWKNARTAPNCWQRRQVMVSNGASVASAPRMSSKAVELAECNTLPQISETAIKPLTFAEASE